MTTLTAPDELSCHGVGAAPGARSIVAHAMHRLEAHHHFRGRTDQFSFVYRSGDQSLTVRGNVPSFYLRLTVELALRGLPGVRRIDNQVDVICASGLSSERSI